MEMGWIHRLNERWTIRSIERQIKVYDNNNNNNNNNKYNL